MTTNTVADTVPTIVAVDVDEDPVDPVEEGPGVSVGAGVFGVGSSMRTAAKSSEPALAPLQSP